MYRLKSIAPTNPVEVERCRLAHLEAKGFQIVRGRGRFVHYEVHCDAPGVFSWTLVVSFAILIYDLFLIVFNGQD